MAFKQEVNKKYLVKKGRVFQWAEKESVVQASVSQFWS